MSADRLREAARVLREDSEAASRSDAEGPWTWRVTGDKKWAVVMDADGSWMAQVDDDDRAAYIATMHPGVGLALADWLDNAAANVDFMQAVIDAGRVENPNAALKRTKADDVADLILGGTCPWEGGDARD